MTRSQTLFDNPLFVPIDSGFPYSLTTGDLNGGPRSVVFTDVDNDHQQDIVVGDVGIKTIQIIFIQTT